MTNTTNTKLPDVGGMFYPDNPKILSEMIQSFLDKAKPTQYTPLAIVAPHAGYVYSGPIAGSAYHALDKVKEKINTLIVISPAHRYGFRGVARHSADLFQTPLGNLKVNKELLDQLDEFEQVVELDEAFESEHALEVHLPFIQEVFKDKISDISIVPLVVGMTKPEEVAEVIEKIWQGDDRFLIVSSDMSHFLSYKDAKNTDFDTSQVLEKLDWQQLAHDSACGYFPLRGLMQVCQKRGLHLHSIDL
ncbi:MAG: AmmeMemoRadiSam system protein B, partial [Bacteriovoracia bacterium]